MKVESMNTSSYQAQHKSQAQGREAKVAELPKVEKLKVEKSKVQNKKIEKQDVEVATTEKQEENEAQVIKAIEKANAHIRTYDRRMEFSIHDKTKQIMVKVIDTEDDSVIREIPSEKVLDMVASMWELAGILVDEKI